MCLPLLLRTGIYIITTKRLFIVENRERPSTKGNAEWALDIWPIPLYKSTSGRMFLIHKITVSSYRYTNMIGMLVLFSFYLCRHHLHSVETTELQSFLDTANQLYSSEHFIQFIYAFFAVSFTIFGKVIMFQSKRKTR